MVCFPFHPSTREPRGDKIEANIRIGSTCVRNSTSPALGLTVLIAVAVFVLNWSNRSWQSFYTWLSTSPRVCWTLIFFLLGMCGGRNNRIISISSSFINTREILWMNALPYTKLKHMVRKTLSTLSLGSTSVSDTARAESQKLKLTQFWHARKLFMRTNHGLKVWKRISVESIVISDSSCHN